MVGPRLMTPTDFIFKSYLRNTNIPLRNSIEGNIIIPTEIINLSIVSIDNTNIKFVTSIKNGIIYRELYRNNKHSYTHYYKLYPISAHIYENI